MLDSTTIRYFHDNGFVVVEELLAANHVADILRQFQAFEENLKSGDAPVLAKDVVRENFDASHRPVKYIQHINHYQPYFTRLFSSKILDVACSLLDQEVFFVDMEIHDKAPRIGTFTPAHQDNFYFCLDPADALTAYVPLESHGQRNGGLCFVKGSHKGPLQPHNKSNTAAFSSAIDLSDVTEDRIYRTEVEPGSVIFHHAKTIHFATDNRSDLHRRSVSIRINGVNARVSPEMRATYLENLRFNREMVD